MGAPFFAKPTVKDAAIAMAEAADRLRLLRIEYDRIAAELEARWAINRATRK